MNAYTCIYFVYSLAIGYSILSSAFILPNYICVFILSVLFQLPVLYVDKSWRINLFTVGCSAVYLICIWHFKNPAVRADELINVFSIGILAIIIGQVTRSTKLENYTTKEMLRKYAYNDTLTKLSNRRQLFEDFALSEKEPMKRYIQGIAILDIDNFKTFNDLYGHQVGDSCLAKVANTLRYLEHKYPMHCYRYGGEEFLITFYEKDVETFLAICKTVNQAIQTLGIPHEGHKEGVVTISIGLAMLEENTPRKYEHLLTLADRALYHVKETGRNKVALYNDSFADIHLDHSSFRERK